MVLVLEDNPDRVVGFRAVLDELAPGLRMVVWFDAHAMIREVGEYLAEAKFISLDHDLEMGTSGLDPGDGLDVAKFLVSGLLVRPVIVHSSNSDRARCMVGEFGLANWPCSRVPPIGDRWIEDDWRVVVAKLLAGAPRDT
jgi:hypothetical protein